MKIFPVFDKGETHLLTDQRTDRPSYRDTKTHLSTKQVVMAVNDASSSDFFIALPKMSIFITFHESVMDRRMDRRTDGQSDGRLDGRTRL